MKLTILDKKHENKATCYLCRVDLKDYVNSIPKDYKDFDVQRGIVNNEYLDHLVDTVENKRHIPPIVLVSNNEFHNENTLELIEFKILDGLQRTHRLKVIFDTINIIIKHIEPLTESNINSFYRGLSSQFKKIGATRQLVKYLSSCDVSRYSSADEFFDGNNLWLEVWCGLSEDEQIKKMLLLNAGHKSVNIKHQLELLFLGTLLKLEEISNSEVEFQREKDVSATQYSKNRKCGQYHFSHIISALISMSAGKVVNTNTDFISGIQSGDVSEVEILDEFNIEFLRRFIDFLYELDKSLYATYGDSGLRWLGREVVLVGFFGALGAYAKDNDLKIYDLFNKLEHSTNKLVRTLSIDDFEKERNKVELNKVNVGAINKKAVYLAVYDILSIDKFTSWALYFGGRNI